MIFLGFDEMALRAWVGGFGEDWDFGLMVIKVWV